jgi:hypothetical protein
MSLTLVQLQALKAAMTTDPNVAADLAAGNDGNIAIYYNSTDPTRTVWKPNVTVHDMNTAIVWSEFVVLTDLKQRAYMAITQNGTVDATSLNVRNGFNSIFGASSSLTNLTAIAQQPATRFEALDAFWVTTGGTVGVTSVFGFRLSLNGTDVSEARKV